MTIQMYYKVNAFDLYMKRMERVIAVMLKHKIWINRDFPHHIWLHAGPGKTVSWSFLFMGST